MRLIKSKKTLIIVAAIVFGFVAMFFTKSAPEVIYEIEPSQQIEITKPTVFELITKYSEQYNVSEKIMTEIIDAESDFLNVCNTDGCTFGIGPAQIVQTTFDTYCEGYGDPVMKDVYDENDNVQCMAKMISEKRYGHWYFYSGDEWFPKLTPELQREVFTYVKPKCSCVEYVRELSDFQPRKVINASDIPVVQTKPIAGGWILFINNHVGFVWSVNMTERTVDVWDKGIYREECRTTKKTYNINDPRIRGYYW